MDKANNHLAHVQEVMQKNESEYLWAIDRVEEQKALVEPSDKAHWEARKRLESSSDGEEVQGQFATPAEEMVLLLHVSG